LFILDFFTLVNLPLPAVYKQAAAQPFEALGQRLTPLLFWRSGAKYNIKVSKLFFAVLLFVLPLLS
tara:strand:- start:355 stop:552 length:198 start_codon:yes stop_codon:yes gene_type:complete